MARSYPRPRQKPVADRYPRPRQKPVDPRQAHIQQLNDELAEDIITASDSPLVRLGIETVGMEQMTTLLGLERGVLARFRPGGYTEEKLKKKAYRQDRWPFTGYPVSPIAPNKPTVVYPLDTMVSRGLAGSRSDIGHEFIHAGVEALGDPVSRDVEESVARHHDMVTGTPDEREIVRERFKKEGWSHESAKKRYNQLNKQAAKKLNDQLNKQVADRLRRRQQRIEAKTFELPDDGGFLRNTRVF